LLPDRLLLMVMVRKVVAKAEIREHALAEAAASG